MVVNLYLTVCAFTWRVKLQFLLLSMVLVVSTLLFGSLEVPPHSIQQLSQALTPLITKQNLYISLTYFLKDVT